MIAVATAVATMLIGTTTAEAARPPRAHAAVINGTLATGPGPLALIATDAGMCSGSVISTNVVLTAAHCVRDEDTGEMFDSSTFIVQTSAVHKGDPGAFYSRVSRTVSHSWVPATGYGDVAVVQLSTPTPAPSLPLATTADIGLLTAGTGTVVEGWGVWQLGASVSSDDLRAGSQVVQGPSYCSAQAQLLHFTINTSATLCAIDPSGTYGICSGDSGGPLVAMRPDRTIAEIGISSSTASTCDTQHPGFYTRVDAFSDWISSWVTALAPPPPGPVAPPKPQASTPAPVATPTPAPTPTPVFTPTPVRASPPTRFSAYTAHGGYLSASVPADGLHVNWLRIGQQLRCRAGRTTYINDIFNAPTAGWSMSATAPLKLTLTKPASRRFFRRFDTITLTPGPGGIYGSVRVTMRARARALGTCTAQVRSFRLRAPRT